MSQEPLRLLFYEPDHEGHHLVYLSFLLPAYENIPVDITVLTTPEAVESSEWANSLGRLSMPFTVETSCTRPPRGRPLASAAHRLKQLQEGVNRLRPDHVIVMYGDGLWQLAAIRASLGRRLLPPGVGLEAWLWRGGFVYDDAPRSAILKRLLFRKLLKRSVFDTLHIDDDLLYEYANSQKCCKRTAIVLSPNPVSFGDGQSQEGARRSLALPEDGTIITLLAMIDKRKGAHLLLEAFAALQAREPNRCVHLVLAGPLHDNVRAILDTPFWQQKIESRELIVRDEFLSPDKMFQYACACDLMTAPYPYHSGRSSLVIWAAAAGRPTLGSARGCIGHVISSMELGWVADPRDTNAFTEAMIQAIDTEWTQEDADRARSYAAGHTFEEFRRSGSALVQRRVTPVNTES